MWDWRINGAQWEGFHYTMSYPSWERMVDFAAEQGFAYLVLDANWYGPEFEQGSDPVKGDKARDVRKLIQYGKQKGVGIWLYLNCNVGGRNYPLEETLKAIWHMGSRGEVWFYGWRWRRKFQNEEYNLIPSACAIRCTGTPDIIETYIVCFSVAISVFGYPYDARFGTSGEGIADNTEVVTFAVLYFFRHFNGDVSAERSQ